MLTRVAWPLAALALALGVPAAAGEAGAAFTGATATGATVAADVLDPPSGLAAQRSCTATPTSLRAVSQVAGTGTSITVPRPAGVVAGDVLVAVLGHADHGVAPAATVADGWQVVSGGNYGTDGSSLFASKIAGASEPTEYTFTGLTSGSATAVAIVAYRSAVWNYPAHGVNYATSTTIEAPSTNGYAESVLVTGFLAFGEPGSIATPAGSTARASLVAPGSAPVSLLVTDRLLTGTGTTGATVATLGTSRANQGMSLALQPGPGPSPVTLTWTPTTDVYATGYEVYRSDYPTVFAVGGPRMLSSYTDTSLGGAGATYYIRSTTSGTWRSAFTSVTVPPC